MVSKDHDATNDIRQAYVDAHKDEYELNYGEYTNQQGKFQRLRDDFDAWLAAHDAEVIAQYTENAKTDSEKLNEIAQILLQHCNQHVLLSERYRVAEAVLQAGYNK